MPEEPVGCARPTGRVVGVAESATEAVRKEQKAQEGETMIAAKVGSKAPDFEAPA